MPRLKKDRRYKNPEDDPRVQGLLKNWPTLTLFQRGDKIKPLREEYTLQELEKILPCSEKRIRDLIDLGEAPASFRAGPRMGIKKILKNQRAFLGQVRKWKKLTTGKSRQQLREKLTRTLVRWCTDVMAPHCWDAFFDEIITTPGGREDIHRNRPAWSEVKMDGVWEAVIARTKPPGGPEDPVWDDVLGYYRLWFARWYLRCMPVPEVAWFAVCQARRELRERTRSMRSEMGWSGEWWWRGDL